MARPRLDIKDEQWRRRCEERRNNGSKEDIESLTGLKSTPIVVDPETHEWLLNKITP